MKQLPQTARVTSVDRCRAPTSFVVNGSGLERLVDGNQLVHLQEGMGHKKVDVIVKF